MRSTPSPKAEKNRGKTPQLMPSLRLLTSPACEQAKRLRSSKVVLAKTSRKHSGLGSGGCCSISSLTCSPVSRTKKTETRSPSDSVADPEVERLRPEAVYRGEVAGRQGRQPDREVPANSLRPTARPRPARPHEVDLHDDRHGPREALVDPEQHVGRDDPPPRGGSMIMNGTGTPTTQPATSTFFLPDAIRQGARYQVGARLDHPEGDDEREDRRVQHQPELLGADQGDHGALQAYHPAHEGVDQDQQRELPPVLLQTEADDGRALRLHERQDLTRTRRGATPAMTSENLHSRQLGEKMDEGQRQQRCPRPMSRCFACYGWRTVTLSQLTIGVPAESTGSMLIVSVPVPQSMRVSGSKAPVVVYSIYLVVAGAAEILFLLPWPVRSSWPRPPANRSGPSNGMMAP